MKRFNMSPEFKAQAQKWGLFGSLVATLGFNLSWNPDLTSIARYENVIHSIELAETAAPAEVKTEPKTATDPNMGTDVDLSKFDSRLKYVMTVYQSAGNTAVGKIKKKTETSGTTDDCAACTFAKLKADASFNPKNLSDINSAVIAYIQDHQKELLDGAEKDKSKDKPATAETAASDDKCAGKKGSRLLDCKMDLYKSLTSKCSDKKMEDKAKDSCEAKLDDAFSTIEEAYKTCSSRSRRSEDIGFGSSSAASIDCDSLQDFVVDDVLPNSPNFGQVNKSLKFVNRRIQMELAAKQADMKAAGLAPYQINQQLAVEIDKTIGTGVRYNPQTLKWEVSPTPVVADSLGMSIFDSLLENPNFTSEKAAANLFQKNLYSPYASLRSKTLSNPSGTGNNSALSNYNFDAMGGTSVIPENLGTLGRTRGTSIPLPPPMAGAQNGGNQTPPIVRLGNSPISTTTFPTTNLLSPAQRGQLPQNGTF